MGIQSGINRVLTLAGTVSAIHEKIKKDADKEAAAAAVTKPKKPDAVSAKAEEKVAARNEEIQRSREFAKMITEGVPNLSFDPNEYVPPERKEK